MLKLTYTPTTEITDRDLVPGSKWRRKSDGAECVLIEWGTKSVAPWLVVYDGRAISFDGGCALPARKAIEVLRRDFERVGGALCPYKTVKEVPCGVMFDTSAYKRLIKVVCGYDHDNILFADEWRVDQIGHNAAVTRVYGPIEIDESVKGVG